MWAATGCQCGVCVCGVHVCVRVWGCYVGESTEAEAYIYISTSTKSSAAAFWVSWKGVRVKTRGPGWRKTKFWPEIWRREVLFLLDKRCSSLYNANHFMVQNCLTGEACIWSDVVSAFDMWLNVERKQLTEKKLWQHAVKWCCQLPDFLICLQIENEKKYAKSNLQCYISTYKFLLNVKKKTKTNRRV